MGVTIVYKMAADTGMCGLVSSVGLRSVYIGVVNFTALVPASRSRRCHNTHLSHSTQYKNITTGNALIVLNNASPF